MRVLDEVLAPLAERLSRLAFPVDSIDVLAKLLGSRSNCVARLLERLPRALQVGGIGLFDQIDHVVEAVTFEAHRRHPESEPSSVLLRCESGMPSFSRWAAAASRSTLV